MVDALHIFFIIIENNGWVYIYIVKKMDQVPNQVECQTSYKHAFQTYTDWVVF